VRGRHLRRLADTLVPAPVTTAEMTRNVGSAAGGAAAIASSITTVADAAQTASTGADRSREHVGDLARMSAELRELVERFRVR
jgi:methyl-accepting chemotaxis protein